jgi:hypothetical protein
MNHFFNMCNSKDTDEKMRILVLGKHNANKYAKKFFEFLAWFNNQKSWEQSLPGTHRNNTHLFIPDQTFSPL